METIETVLPWSHNRRLHLVAPGRLLQSVDLAMVERVLARIDDLDRVADAIAELTGRPVRVRGWESPTSDFFVEIKASRESGGCGRPRP